ncbi:hypothetical protein QFC21_007068 [Naganishia friedmannii]|uniref:Uncharacterized protein n=1 Tax=Naganishia friedmannii TaxID=89922 RepID=A0ACC2UXR4_9TREE|nr:hypothetical protein QFC21_007068 [Naganishia friedmannii]
MFVIDTVLPHLPSHLPTLLKSTLLFFFIQLASYTLSPILFPKTLKVWSRKEKLEWSSRVVALAHSLLILPMAFSTYNDPQLRQDPIFGYNPRVGEVLAFTCGYFIWDTVDSTFNSSAGFVVHAVACLAVFGFSFEKFGIDKKVPALSMVNDLLFVLAFFFARILGGSKDVSNLVPHNANVPLLILLVFGGQSFVFFREMIKQWNQIPTFLFLVYGTGNLALNGLNWLWFSKIVKRTIRTLGGGSARSSTKKTNGEVLKAEVPK